MSLLGARRMEATDGIVLVVIGVVLSGGRGRLLEVVADLELGAVAPVMNSSTPSPRLRIPGKTAFTAATAPST